MKIITCIKQVPASSKVDVDPDTGVLIRDGNNVKMNPYDLYALEAGFLLKNEHDINIHAITMGPPSAKNVLMEALYMGADDATLISDRRFAGADVLATAYTLSQLIEHIDGYSVVICGKQTTDGDTAQVGPEIAEFLNIPHVPYVVDILEMNEQSIIVKSNYEQYEEIVEVKLPCLLTIEKGHYVPRLPSFRRKMAIRDYKIDTVTLSDLKDTDQNNYGLKGSPTQVVEIFPPVKSNDSTLINGSPEVTSKELHSILQDKKFI